MYFKIGYTAEAYFFIFILFFYLLHFVEPNPEICMCSPSIQPLCYSCSPHWTFSASGFSGCVLLHKFLKWPHTGKPGDHWSELLGFQIFLTFCPRQLNYSLMPSLQGLEWRQEYLAKPVTHITWSPPQTGKYNQRRVSWFVPHLHPTAPWIQTVNSQGLTWIVSRWWKFSWRMCVWEGWWGCLLCFDFT